MKVKVKDIAKVQGGFAFKSSDFLSKGIPIIRIGNIENLKVKIDYNICYKEEFWNENKIYRINYGDILIALSGATVGKVGMYLSKDKALLNQRVAMLLPFENIDKKYLFYYCLSPMLQNQIKKNAFGCAQPNISIKQIEEFFIELPILTEQKQIVSILDTVSGIIEKRKKQLEDLDELVKARFVEMFGDPVENPMGWDVVPLKNVSNLITNGNTPKGGSSNYVDKSKGVIFLRSQNVWRNRLELDDVVYIDKKTHENMKKSSVHNDDILLTKTGRINTENSSLGRAALYKGKDNSANINGHVYLIRLKKVVIPEYIVTILTSESYRNYIRRVCVGGIDKRQINITQVEDFPIIIPSIQLQLQFVNFVKQMEEIKEKVQKSLDETQVLFDKLMQDYFG